MKNIIITAGGTSEPIDGVRTITNSGTGRLGSLTADELSSRHNAGKIFYVCSNGAYRPKSEHAEVVTVTTVSDLQDALSRIISEHKIDAIIHSMAVSDYKVRAVSEPQRIARALRGTTPHDLIDALDSTDMRKGTEKLSSKISSPVILLEPTPKVLSTLRPSAPEAVIVGFKLLSRVPKEQLFEVAEKLMESNGCDYVLANDSSEISGDSHHAFLMSRGGNRMELFTKQEIARALADAVTKEC